MEIIKSPIIIAIILVLVIYFLSRLIHDTKKEDKNLNSNKKNYDDGTEYTKFLLKKLKENNIEKDIEKADAFLIKNQEEFKLEFTFEIKNGVLITDNAYFMTKVSEEYCNMK